MNQNNSVFSNGLYVTAKVNYMNFDISTILQTNKGRVNINRFALDIINNKSNDFSDVECEGDMNE